MTTKQSTVQLLAPRTFKETYPFLKDEDAALLERYPAETLQLLQLTTMLLADTLPTHSIAYAYLVSETPDNQESVIARARELINMGDAQGLIVADFEYDEQPIGYLGAKEYLKQLQRNSVAPHRVITVKPKPNHRFVDPPQTTTEMAMIIDFIADKEAKELIIIAPPFHLLRSYIAAVTAIIRSRQDICIWVAPGTPLAWEEQATHSQGSYKDMRKNFIITEVVKCLRYWEYDHIVSPRLALAHYTRHH